MNNWITSSYSNAEGNCIEADGPWRTSSYSDASGTQCVEASGPWYTSSYSEAGANPNCVEIGPAWHTSSHSGESCQCVEVSGGAVVRVRDTKDRERGHFAVSGAAWTAFLGGIPG